MTPQTLTISPDPMGVAFTDPSGNVSFDTIKTSTFAAPTITGVYMLPVNPWLTSPDVTIVVKGTGFLNFGGSKHTQGAILQGLASQPDITITSTSWDSATQIRIFAHLLTP